MDMDTLKQMMDMHIKECDGRDARNVKTADDIRGMFKGIWDSQEKMSDKLTALQIRMAFGIGGLFALGKAMDYYLSWVHK